MKPVSRLPGNIYPFLKLSGEDLGTQTSTLFSYRVWEEIIYPILARRWQAARRALDKYGGSHVKMMLHSDGAFRPFIPDIIKAGVDVLDPIQKVCPGMALEGLSRILEISWYSTAALIRSITCLEARLRK